MKKRMIIMLISLGLLFGSIFAYKTFANYMLQRYLATRENIATVSTMTAERSPWQSEKKYYGSLLPVKGVNVTTEIAGLVEKIHFKPGATVKKGDLLVQLNASADRALLQSLAANTALAKSILKRDTAQYAIHAISKVTLDTNSANFKSLTAQSAQQAAIVDKKSIRAPFDGRLGIIDIHEGQYLNVGDPITPLQDLSSLYADFYVPQQALMTVKIGQPVSIIIDAFPDNIFNGHITTINPIVDANTRNVKVQATLPNPKSQLIPGMFATILVKSDQSRSLITLPQTAVSFNSFGDVVFTVHEKGKDTTGKPILTVTQRIVRTGETRGDQITILDGLNVGDIVVTSGQLKLKNGSRVVVNNAIVPTNDPAPQPSEE